MCKCKSILVSLHTSIFLLFFSENNGAQIDLDIAVIISMVGCYYFNFSYLSKIKEIAGIFTDFTKFQTFEMPLGYQTFNKKWNKLSTLHFTYYVLLVSLCLLMALPESKTCLADKVRKGTHEICGLALNLWLPFEFDYFPMKQIICCYQIYSVFFSYVLSSTISFSIMESMEHVIFRLDYVKQLFAEAIRQDDDDIRKNIFKHSIEYHSFVIR